MRIFWGYCLVWKLSWQRNASWYLECITNLVVSCGILPAHPTKPRVHEKHPFWGRAVNVCLSNFPCPVKHRQNPEVFRLLQHVCNTLWELLQRGKLYTSWSSLFWPHTRFIWSTLAKRSSMAEPNLGFIQMLKNHLLCQMKHLGNLGQQQGCSKLPFLN